MGYEFRESKDYFYIFINEELFGRCDVCSYPYNKIVYKCKEIHKNGRGYSKWCACKVCKDDIKYVSFETVMEHNITHLMIFLFEIQIKNIDKEQKFCIGQKYINYNLHITIRDKELVEDSKTLYIDTIHKADSSIHMLSLCLLRLGIYKDLRFSIISKIRKIWWV